MENCRIEAVILRTIRYGDNDQIVTAFSRELGVIKLIFKGGHTRRSKGTSLISPLSRLEMVFAKGRGELYLGRESTSLESYSGLRENLACLQAGCAMLDAIHESQGGEREATLLYDLLCLYLRRLPELRDVNTAVCSFYLKVLKHEGLLSPDIIKNLNEEEQLIIQFLAGSRRFTDFIELVLPKYFTQTVKHLFNTMNVR